MAIFLILEPTGSQVWVEYVQPRHAETDLWGGISPAV
jgi:hypothetical protein